MTDSIDTVEASRMPLMEHLSELRKRIIMALIATALGCALSFFYVLEIWDFLVAPMQLALEESGKGSMAITEPLEGFVTQLKVAVVAGLGLASPMIFYQMWKFVAPGLYPKEQNMIIPLVIASTFLFLGGVAFGYTVIFRFAFSFFLEVTPDDVEAMLSINSYLGIATRLLVAFGLCFQLPVVVFFLARIGLIHHRDMVNGFRYAIVAIFALAAFLTPPDVISQLLLAGPLIFLYGVGIVIARVCSTKPLKDSED